MTKQWAFALSLVFVAASGVLLMQAQSTAGLVLWNTLGSDSEVSNSVVGPPLTLAQSVSYSPALLGNGILAANQAPVVIIPKRVLNAEQGTVALWVRLVNVPASFANGEALDFMNVQTSQHSTFQLEFTANDGLGHSGWAAKLWDAQYFVYFFNTYGTTSTRTLGTNGEDVFISYRWNRNGVPGHDSQKLVVARDLRQASKYYQENIDALWGTDFLADATLNLQFFFGTNVSLIYDDIKVYDRSVSDKEIRGRYCDDDPQKC